MSVYFIHAPEVGRVKIGYATDAISRFRKICSDCCCEVILCAVIDGDLDREADLHSRFSDYRENGEWFRFEGEIVAFVEGLGQQFRLRRMPTSIPDDASELLRARKRANLSQADLADRLGVTQSTVSRFERGELKLDTRTRLALEAIFSADPVGVAA